MRTLFQRRSARVLALSYAVALSLVAGATLVIHHGNARSIEKQDRLGALINVSGRQRMLSQRIAYLRQLVEAPQDDEEFAQAAANYAAALDAFLTAHDRLTRGDLVWGPDHPRAAALSAVYYADDLDNDARRYAVEAEMFAEAAQTGRDALLPSRPDDLLARLDKVTTLHEEASQEIVDDGRAFARRALALVIALLLAEGAVVMLPTAKRLARVEDELTTLATTDPLTGARNRRSLFGAAQSLVRLGARARRPVTAIVLDIDHFKRVNDEHGHAVGDDAIKHVVNIAAGVIRDSDLLGRVGGEEFVIFCPETGAEGGTQVAEKVRAAVEAAPLPLGEDQLSLTVSVGVHGALPGRQDVAEDFVAAADEALYEAKQRGRNRVVATRPSPNEAVLGVA